MAIFLGQQENADQNHDARVAEREKADVNTHY